MFESLAELTDKIIASGIPGNDCILMKDGKVIYRRYAGYSDAEAKIPMSGKERYNIYSCSKPITCVAAMQLWERGGFSLDDALSDYLPAFREMTVQTPEGIKKAQKPIRIHHLFEMTAGLSYRLDTPAILQCKKETEGKCPTVRAAEAIAQSPLLFEPGERWEYSLCHDVLAALVEVVSGERFGTYVKKNVFERVGMTHSTFSLPAEETDTLAAQYKFDSDGKRVRVSKEIQSYKLGSEYESGGAGCISSVEDYVLFLEAMREGEILLKRGTIDLMKTDRLTEGQRPFFWSNPAYGYGLGMRCPWSGSDNTDFGWGGAAGAYLAIDPENHLSFFYAQHVLASPVQGLRPELYQCAKTGALGK